MLKLIRRNNKSKIFIVSFLLLFFFSYEKNLCFAAGGHFIGDYELQLENEPYNSKNKNYLFFKLEDVNPSVLNPKSSPRKFTNIVEIIDMMTRAKYNSKIDGVFFYIQETTNIRLAQIFDLISVIKEFKKSGKEVIMYAEILQHYNAILALYADKVFCPSNTSIKFNLPEKIAIPFTGEFLKEIGIDVQVIKKRRFKNAWAPFALSKSTPEVKSEIISTIKEKKDYWYKVIKEAPRFSKIKIDIDILSGFQTENSIYFGENIKDTNFIDKFINLHEISDYLKENYNLFYYTPDATKEFYPTLIDIIYGLREAPKEIPGNKIAIVQLHGRITNDPYPGKHIHFRTYKKLFERLSNDNTIKAVIFKVDSLGGNPRTTMVVMDYIKDLAKKKLVVSYIENHGLSGAYAISLPSKKIFANPFSVIGGVGVTSANIVYKNLLDRLKINIEEFNLEKDPKYSIGGLSYNKWDEKTKENLEKFYEQLYTGFKSIVSKHRNLSMEKVEELAQGRVYSSRQGAQVGLIDEVGSLLDAIKFVKKSLPEQKNLKVVLYPDAHDFIGYLQFLLKSIPKIPKLPVSLGGLDTSKKPISKNTFNEVSRLLFFQYFGSDILNPRAGSFEGQMMNQLNSDYLNMLFQSEENMPLFMSNFY